MGKGGGRMTEYKCGSAKSCQFGKMCKPNYNIGACSHYKAEEPQTNEEYLKSCNTEQLADLMSRMVGCSNCPIPKDGRNCIGTYSGCWHEIIKWLKQPHKPIS